MIHFIKSLLTVFVLALFVVAPSAESALNAYDRQEFTFENALADKNPGFESGVTQWTASGGTFVSNSGTQIIPNSKQFATWDSNSASQTLQTSAVTVPKTGNCEFSIWIAVPSGTATHTITVTDGSNDLVTAQTITNNTNALKHIVNFPCPASGTVRGKLTSVNSNEPSISLDNARLGSATNVGTVQQAIHKGSIIMTGCTDWSRSNGAFGDFAATAGCTYTVTGDVLSPSTFIPGFRLQNVAPGRYLIMARGYFGKSVTTTNADISFRFSDGTNTFSEQIAVSAASASGQAIGVGQISGSITYATTQSTLTFQVQGQTSSTASSTAAVISDDGGANATTEINGLQFEVFYFPTSQQSVVTSIQQRPPKITRYTSGTGTHTTTPGTTYIRVLAVGGGGGGGSSGTAAWGAATAGGNTTFGTSLITANGGTQGTQSGISAGGTASVGAGAIGTVIDGASGGGASYSGTASVLFQTGHGGVSCLGGGGSLAGYDTVGNDARANSGSGGGGGGMKSAIAALYGGAGGGAGGCVDAIIESPSASYSYNVGTGGSHGSAGTNGFAGGNGAAGYIEVIEYFGYTTAILANSVSSSVTNGTRIESASYAGGAGSCGTLTQVGDWISSCSRSGTGWYSVTFKTGVFSASPICVPVAGASSTTVGAHASLIAISSTNLQVLVTNESGTEVDNYFGFTCHGNR